jgi:hypothetical protein
MPADLHRNFLWDSGANHVPDGDIPMLGHEPQK